MRRCNCGSCCFLICELVVGLDVHCFPKRHSFPGRCNLITMSLGCGLMAIATSSTCVIGSVLEPLCQCTRYTTFA